MDEEELTYSDKGYWVSKGRFKIKLEKPIEDVEIFGNSLVKFLQWQYEEGAVPFEIIDIYPMFVDYRCACNEGGPYYQKGFVFIIVKKKSILGRINPFHDDKWGDESIIIEFEREEKKMESYQEKHSEYCGCTYRWKLPIESIKEFRALLNKFAGGHWLGINEWL